MRHRIYIYMIMVVIYIQLYRQSNRIEEIDDTDEIVLDWDTCMEIDENMQNWDIDSIYSHIQLDGTSWQNNSVADLDMLDEYIYSTQYDQYEQQVKQNNTHYPYYSENNSDSIMSKEASMVEQNVNALHSTSTNNSINIALNMYVPYSAAMAKQPSRNIANTNINISVGTDDLLNIRNIKKCIYIEKQYIVIDMYMLYNIKDFSALIKELDKYDGYKIYIQYNSMKNHKKFPPERIQDIKMWLYQFDTVVVWGDKGSQQKTEKMQSIKLLLKEFNKKHKKIQQFIERTNEYMDNSGQKGNKDNNNKKNRKRIVLYKISINCIYNLAYLVQNRDVISCYTIRQSGGKSNIRKLLREMQNIHVLDIVTSSKKCPKSLVTFAPYPKNKPKSKEEGAAIKANLNIGIDSIDNSKDINTHAGTSKNKAPLNITIRYLSLIDRLSNRDGIGNISYILKKITDRLDLTYSLWTQLAKRSTLLLVPVHTLVIYTTISEEKKETLKQAQQNTYVRWNKMLATKNQDKSKECTKNTKRTQIKKQTRKNVSATSKSDQADANKTSCLISSMECIKEILAPSKLLIRTRFPKLKTLVIYVYESDRKDIEDNIKTWLNNEYNHKKSLHMKNMKELQIYFVPDGIKVDSTKLLASEYIYNDKARLNLNYLCYNRGINDIFVKTTLKEISTVATALVPVV
ncbi:hypothetical protein NEOKW01_0021 [Nematocida sp. AWRm80]|nr:hypothetical protein NEOKW01_0021 [Nematocida sp. AWRm80]